MPQKKIIQLDIKHFPYIPDQEEFDWVASYIDKKEDSLYSVVFGYQMIDSILRVLIIRRSGEKVNAEVNGMRKLIKKFEKFYPEQKEVKEELFQWKVQRDIINHALLFNEGINSSEKLEKIIKDTAKRGEVVYKKLSNLLVEENIKAKVKK